MTWRVVVINSNSKLDLKLNHLVIRTDVIRKVHLSEISVLIIESTAVSMTSMLLCELNRRKIKVLFCDETHNPYGELVPYYGCHDSSDRLRQQIGWKNEIKDEVWARIVTNKIVNQSRLAARYDYQRSSAIATFAGEVQPGDCTNREGHAAKVYFNTLFGEGFSRRQESVTNSCLNYGYSILLASVNREITGLGFSTELGIFHSNTFNHFNLGSDLMEPLRPLVDMKVVEMEEPKFNTETKHELASILNTTVNIDGREQFLMNAVRTYVKSVTDSLCTDNIDISFCEYEI